MDNLAHGLAGAALGEAGLKKKTGLGMATLIIAANLPDVDALGLLFGENLAWRRGWTHGPIAMLVLPPLLVGAMVLFDRWQARRGARPAERLPIHVGWLLALAYVGWASHPLLDFMNTYGIQLLMPFSERWFYGDTLFIIDVWLWTALAIGVWLSRRRRRRGSAKSRPPGTHKPLRRGGLHHGHGREQHRCGTADARGGPGAGSRPDPDRRGQSRADQPVPARRRLQHR